MVSFVLVVALLVAVTVLVIFVVGHNKIRAADVRVDEALGGIDVQLTRRAALIPALVSTVTSHAAHEQAVLEHIGAARRALASATKGDSVARRSSAEQEFDHAVAQVLALGQAYPQLNSSRNFVNLQENLADTEDKLAFARQYYNDAVASLNKVLGSIPWMFVAGYSGVGQREYYQSPH